MAIAAAADDLEAAAAAFVAALEQMEDHEERIPAAMYQALMASMLGVEEVSGHRMARRAYDELTSTGASTILELIPTGVLPPGREELRLA